MTHFLAMSVARARRDDPAIAAIGARLRGQFDHAADGDALLCVAPGLTIARHAGLATADRRAPAFDEATGRAVDPAALGDEAAISALALAAPAAVAGVRNGVVRAAADRAGQGHLYTHMGDGFAAVASSAAWLARAFDLPPNIDALVGLALVGTPVADDSLWAGVTLAPMGAVLRLGDGRIEALPFAPLPFADAAPLRDTMAALSDAWPDAEIDLSGGWDTRLLLAALPADRRARHGALTLGHAGDPDVVVAQAIAARFGLRHRILNPVAITAIDPDQFFAALEQVAALDEFSLNPMDRVLYHLLNRQSPGGVRFNGQNGEIVRGFYYPAQPVEAPPTRALAERLVDWRLIANDRADATLFRADWFADRAAAVRSRLADRVLAMPGATWGDRLDALYLHERMRRWNGQSASSAMASRRMLAPFFAARFLDWAMRQPVAAKVGARMPARLIAEYEPALLRMPLDNGLTPAMMLEGGLEARWRKARLFARKAAGKMAQRLGRAAGGTMAQGGTIALFRARAMHRRLDLHAIDALGVVAPDRLDAFGRGEWTPDAATLGLLLNLHALGRARA